MKIGMCFTAADVANHRHSSQRLCSNFKATFTLGRIFFKSSLYSRRKGAWLSERLRRWSNKPDVVGSIPDATDFILISCDSNQVPKWFGTHHNLEVPLQTLVKWCYSAGKSVFGVAPAIVQRAHCLVWFKMPP